MNGRVEEIGSLTCYTAASYSGKKTVKKLSGNNLLIVTPGIRPSSYKKNDDQKRIMSPGEAISLGANYLVIGRPITKSLDPIKEIININSEIEKSTN